MITSYLSKFRVVNTYTYVTAKLIQLKKKENIHWIKIFDK